MAKRNTARLTRGSDASKRHPVLLRSKCSTTNWISASRVSEKNGMLRMFASDTSRARYVTKR
jgi:hypothetical protein